MKKFSIVVGSITLIFTLITSVGFQIQARAFKVGCNPVHVKSSLDTIKSLLDAKPFKTDSCNDIENEFEDLRVQIISSSGQGCILDSDSKRKLAALKTRHRDLCKLK